MADATYVAFVPAKKRAELRSLLQAEETGSVAWRERKRLFLSEFYFSGPAGLARRTHQLVTAWLNKP